MDPELIKLIQQAVRDGLALGSWIFILLGLIAAGAGAFLGSYLKTKGEHLATKEDFNELLQQLKAQTKATEEIKGEISERVASATERLKSELSVWAGFRNDVLKDMWTVHRAVVDAMTSVILRTQQAEAGGKIADIQTDIMTYRSNVHRSIDLLTPRAVDIAQQFLGIAYDIAYSRKPPDDANALKAIRRQFYEQMAVYFHLEEVLPWIIQEAS
jgi:hypothetical protein